MIERLLRGLVQLKGAAHRLLGAYTQAVCTLLVNLGLIPRKSPYIIEESLIPICQQLCLGYISECMVFDLGLDADIMSAFILPSCFLTKIASLITPLNVPSAGFEVRNILIIFLMFLLIFPLILDDLKYR